jgi:hypothetical protein
MTRHVPLALEHRQAKCAIENLNSTFCGIQDPFTAGSCSSRQLPVSSGPASPTGAAPCPALATRNKLYLVFQVPHSALGGPHQIPMPHSGQVPRREHVSRVHVRLGQPRPCAVCDARGRSRPTHSDKTRGNGLCFAWRLSATGAGRRRSPAACDCDTFGWAHQGYSGVL